jgi:hypothetical protein
MSAEFEFEIASLPGIYDTVVVKIAPTGSARQQ